jgi:hypothetical protein
MNWFTLTSVRGADMSINLSACVHVKWNVDGTAEMHDTTGHCHILDVDSTKRLRAIIGKSS